MVTPELRHGHPLVMVTPEFQRARSVEAKRHRETAILDAARSMAATQGVRTVTLTDIAAAVGMHKSAMLRYFETREQIFLHLTAENWQEWSKALRARLDLLPPTGEDPEAVSERARAIATAMADSLVTRPLFCDLLAQAPLNLERNVSLDSVRSFKLTALAEWAAVADALRRKLPLSERQARNVVTTATGMAGALWQMSAPGTELRDLYRADPRLAHALVDVGPRLTDILTGLLAGYASAA
jgi:AcrR family transcriptional regulator